MSDHPTAVEEAIQGLASTASGTSEWNLVVISIDLKNEVLELESPPRFVPPADLPASLSEKEPRIAFYRLDDTSIKAAGSATDSGESVVAMLYCCPASSSVKARMLYSSNVLSVLNYVNTFSGMRVVKKVCAVPCWQVASERARLTELVCWGADRVVGQERAYARQCDRRDRGRAGS